MCKSLSTNFLKFFIFLISNIENHAVRYQRSVQCVTPFCLTTGRQHAAGFPTVNERNPHRPALRHENSLGLSPGVYILTPDSLPFCLQQSGSCFTEVFLYSDEGLFPRRPKAFATAPETPLL